MAKKASKAKTAAKAPAPAEQVEAQVAPDQAQQGTKAKVAKKPKAPAAPKKPSGGGVLVKLLLFAEPNLSVDSIMEKLGKASPSKSSVQVIRFEARQCLKLLAQEGLLKEGFPPID